eukprot:707693-Amorphochlora_amoeboformis.AAC.1
MRSLCHANGLAKFVWKKGCYRSNAVFVVENLEILESFDNDVFLTSVDNECTFWTLDCFS